MPDMELGRVSKLLDEHDVAVAGTNQTFGLMDFAHEVSQAIPGSRVTPRDDRWSWVYMPDDHYAMGLIGYGDFRDRGDGTFMYTVKSRNIENGKYNDYAQQYHMKMSASRPTAVKNARAHLRRYTPHDMLEATKAYTRTAISNVVTSVREQHQKLERELFKATFYSDTPAYVAEFKHLLDSGYEFMDRTLADKLATYFKSKVEYDALRNSTLNFTFVCASTYCDTPRVDLIFTDNLTGYSRAPEPALQTYFGSEIADDVSEDIMGKVAMLNMLEDNTYVAGVGYKVFEGIYYAER